MMAEHLELLQKYNKSSDQKSLSELLDEPGRFENFSCTAGALLLDFTRVPVDQTSLSQLLALAKFCDMEAQIERLFKAEAVNFTEHRPALHMALRHAGTRASLAADESALLEQTSEKMLALADALNRGQLPARPVEKITDIVHVGIGGSLLGPRLVYEALPEQGKDAPRIHFLGSVDAHPRTTLLPQLDPRSTVVVLVSKSFSTGDTLRHGRRLRAWLEQALPQDEVAHRLFAVTGKQAAAVSFGVPADQVLHLPDWVGGRYSLWSAVSLSVAARIGSDAFRALLEGAAAMDQHFLDAPLEKNLPVLLALLGIWHRNVCGFPALGVIPYDQRLRSLPAFLQQLIMESNGKSVDEAGQTVVFGTSPVVFGECGTDAQHSLFQAMHQGSDRVPLQMVAAIRPAHGETDAHNELLANMLAQATALAMGRSAQATRESMQSDQGELSESLLLHRCFGGNRPTELLLIDELGPHSLGELLALYEHMVYAQSVIWGINAFDQWGVELGKTLAPGIEQALRGEQAPATSLQGLMEYIERKR